MHLLKMLLFIMLRIYNKIIDDTLGYHAEEMAKMCHISNMINTICLNLIILESWGTKTQTLIGVHIWLYI